jgi:hypothetical protein
MRWLYRTAPPHRTGRNQKRARSAFIGYGPILTGHQLVELIYPRLAGQRLPEWRWKAMRQAAERFGERIEPRTRPLKWRAFDGPKTR